MKRFLARGPLLITTAAVNNTLLDGVAVPVTNAGTITLSTTHANDIIIVIRLEGNGGTSITSISSANVTWDGAVRGAFQGSGGTQNLSWWKGVAAAPLTSEVITVNGSGTFHEVLAFGISGANTSSVFDPGAGIPNQQTGTSVPALTTSNANDFLFAAYSCASKAMTTGAGWTDITGGGITNNFLYAQYKIVTVAGSYSGAILNDGSISSFMDAVQSS